MASLILMNSTGVKMRRRDISLFSAMFVLAAAAGTCSASAQSFQNYRCADGTQFIVGFFDYDKRAYLQIDGGPVTLAGALHGPGRVIRAAASH